MVVTFLFDDYFALNSTLENLNANEHRNFLEDKANYINFKMHYQLIQVVSHTQCTKRNLKDQLCLCKS
jgi:hypothetical protein